jgi:hypothetical protein
MSEREGNKYYERGKAAMREDRVFVDALYLVTL